MTDKKRRAGRKEIYLFPVHRHTCWHLRSHDGAASDSGDDDARKAGDDDGRTASPRVQREREEESARERTEMANLCPSYSLGTLGTPQRCLALSEDKACELGSSIP